MAHIPAEILSNLKDFQEHSPLFISSPVSTLRRYGTADPRMSLQKRQLEQELAERNRQIQDKHRPKFLVKNLPNSTSKPASYFIERARQTYLSKNSPMLSTWNSSTRPERSFCKPKKRIVTSKDTSRPVYPEWILSRINLPENSNDILEIEIDQIVKSNNRTEIEKETLVKWVSTVDYFAKLPKVVIKEAADKLTFAEYAQGQTIIHKGEEADSMYLIYKGSVWVSVEDTKVARIGPKETIGETALDSTSKRNATCIAETALEVFVLNKTDYDNIIFNIKKLEKHESTKFLLSMRYFQSWSFLKVQRLSTCMIVKEFPENSVLYEISDEPSSFYVLKEGKVQIQTYVDLSQQNKWPTAYSEWEVSQVKRKHIINLATLLPGRYFGETDLIEERPRQTRAVATKKSICLIINRNEFFDVFSVKDTDRLLELRYFDIPSGDVLKKRILKEIQLRSSKEKALLDAMKVDFANTNGRTGALDQRSRKLDKWLKNLKDRKAKSSENIKKNVVCAEKKTAKIDSILSRLAFKSDKPF